jgi:alkylation response protein AidB-like acyl-CoA dehydrogenase
VPAENVLGQIGQGHKIAFNILNIGRFKLGAGAVGAAKECLQVALDYARERKQFGKPIASFGMIQRKLADMATRIYVADSMSYRTAGLMDAAAHAVDATASDASQRLVRESVEEYTLEASILKVFGTETLDFVADEALQVLGGYGFTEEYPVERHYRDSRINRIFEGTNEINRLIIPATLVKRISTGALPYVDLFQQVDRELADPSARPQPASGPLAREAAATECAKRVIAYTARVMMERDLASLKDKQQHLEILSNMIIDVFAMDSVVNRTRLLLERGPDDANALRVAMTDVYVASANERLADGARRLVANDFEGEELRTHLANIDALALDLPIRTIAAKTQVAEALVAAGVGPVFLREGR